MILVQKTPVFNLSQALPYTHRRHPSAPPAVIVQPTRTPGLLSLSKPIRSSPQRLLTSNQRAKPPVKPIKQVPANPPVLLNPAEITEKKAPTAVHTPASPSPQTRGRVAANHGRDKITSQRSPSEASARGKHGRQPSPPFQAHPSQAEATIISSSNNIFDPFIDNSDMQVATLTSKPSGKLARRRQQAPSTPSPVMSIPVPTRPKSAQLSRSDPVPSHIRPRPLPKRSSAIVQSQFRICDDMTDAGDGTENDSTLVHTPPVTPRKRTFADSGPRTAPISARNPGAFPFNTSAPSPPASPMSQKHRRTPSEGVFNMSSDEDLSTGPEGVVLNPNVQALFGLIGSRPSSGSASTKPPSTPSPTLSRATAAAFYKELGMSPPKDKERAAGYYASSMFQNSPSPEELPDPLLF